MKHPGPAGKSLPVRTDQRLSELTSCVTDGLSHIHDVFVYINKVPNVLCSLNELSDLFIGKSIECNARSLHGSYEFVLKLSVQITLELHCLEGSLCDDLLQILRKALPEFLGYYDCISCIR